MKINHKGVAVIVTVLLTAAITAFAGQPTLQRDGAGAPIQNVFRPVANYLLELTDSTSARSDSLAPYSIVRLYCPSAVIVNIGDYTVTSTDSTGVLIPAGEIQLFCLDQYEYIAARVKAATGDTLNITVME